jgi:capsular polysaccharide biosynthesis protein
MNVFSRGILDTFWKAKGVCSMQALEPSQGVLAIHDVTAKLEGENFIPNSLTVIELADGKVVGSGRFAATKENVVVEKVQSLKGCRDINNHSALRQRRFRVPKYRQGTAFLLGATSSDCNYYHWLIDSIPRWKIIQEANYSDYDYVLLQESPSRFQDEFLDRLAVPVSKRLHCSKNMVHQFERLVVPSMPVHEWIVPAWSCAWLRSLFPAKNPGPEKIFISRRNAVRRRLSNEADLEKELVAAGFVPVRLEQLSVAQQAELFYSAKCIVASHGAGLANLAFSSTGTSVIEICPSQRTPPFYRYLAAAAGVRYVPVLGIPIERKPEENFAVEVSAVVKTVMDNI